MVGWRFSPAVKPEVELREHQIKPEIRSQFNKVVSG
jgi:hypothetical protein